MESKRACPECHLIFEAELPATGILVCPLCNSAFAALPPAGPAPAAALSPSTASARQMLRGVWAVAILFLLAAGMGYAYHLLRGIDHKTTALPAPAVHTPTASPPPPPVEYVPVIPIEPMPPVTIQPQPRPPIQSMPPMRIQRLPRLNELQHPAIVQKSRRSLPLPERINGAIDSGVAYLRKNHSIHPQYRNYLGLLGLTLLECGVAAGDPSVQQIAAWIRSRELDLAQTYELALAILFLDQLGEQRDRTLIRHFGQRLLKGRFDCGTWSYTCAGSDALRGWQNNLFRNRPTVFFPNHPVPQQSTYCGDNSNTQFAILGLWVAQRYGVPAHPALRATEQYFRNTQMFDGSWTYRPKQLACRDSMTCAGLMSLAMRYGVRAGQGRDIRPDRPVSVHDAAVLRGLRYLAQSLNKIGVRGFRIAGVEARDPLYFLWSLERTAIIYDLKKIGEREWYPWAAQMLVETQLPDGRWVGLGDPAGTCFALLILKRSNFTKDLQLAVQERPSSPMPNVSGPRILEGMDAILEQNRKPQAPATPLLGPSITQTPKTK